MKTAALRLDCFTPRTPEAAASALADALGDAFRQGHELGLSEGRSASLDAVSQALDDLRHDLAASTETRLGHRREFLAEMAPVLEQIVDLLAPGARAGQLCAALEQELARLAGHSPERAVLIRCPADLRPQITACLARAGSPTARLEELLPGQDMVELTCDQSRTLIDPSRLTLALKAIIAEITAED